MHTGYLVETHNVRSMGESKERIQRAYPKSVSKERIQRAWTQSVLSLHNRPDNDECIHQIIYFHWIALGREKLPPFFQHIVGSD